MYDESVTLDSMTLEGILSADSTVTVTEVNPALSEVANSDENVTENAGVYTRVTTYTVGATDENYTFLLPAGGEVSITVNDGTNEDEYLIDCSSLTY